MYTINIKGKSNPKDRKMVKLEMIFFKSGYARVPKVLEVTGLLKDWDAKSQSFRVGSFEATTKNKILSIYALSIYTLQTSGKQKNEIGLLYNWHTLWMR